jgi:hypothetical protein
MQLTKIAGTGCQGTTCPTIYRTDRGSFVVQGIIVATAEGLTLPAGESAVEVPATLVDELVHALGR